MADKDSVELQRRKRVLTWIETVGHFTDNHDDNSRSVMDDAVPQVQTVGPSGSSTVAPSGPGLDVLPSEQDATHIELMSDKTDSVSSSATTSSHSIVRSLCKLSGSLVDVLFEGHPNMIRNMYKHDLVRLKAMARTILKRMSKLINILQPLECIVEAPHPQWVATVEHANGPSPFALKEAIKLLAGAVSTVSMSVNGAITTITANEKKIFATELLEQRKTLLNITESMEEEIQRVV